MPNERLRAAVASAGMTLELAADAAGVDPKTVERWIATNRIPHRSNRQSLAVALGRDESFLWPETLTTQRSAAASSAEFVAIHANRGSMPEGTWQSALAGATQSIDILAFAASFLHDTIAEFDSALVSRARAGTRVRLAFGDPQSDAVRIRGDEENIGDSLAGRCQLTWRYLKPLLGTPGIDARAHGCTLYSSIFRFDDDIFVNTHAYGAPANHSPVLHIHRIPGGRLFDHYLGAFDRVWESARLVSTADVA